MYTYTCICVHNTMLHKIFNRNTMKISHSCWTNINNTISAHYSHAISNKTARKYVNAKTCNCRAPTNCPLDGKCLTKSIVYQATINNKTSSTTNYYVGLTENCFKTRYTNHKAFFTHKAKQHSTGLRTYIWQTKDKGADINGRS